MIKRYEIKEITNIFSEKNKYDNWLRIELLNCEALNVLGIINDSDLDKIKKTIGYNIEDIYEIEKTTKHDVIAFTRAVSKYMNNDVKKWIHFGLTSSDIVDTGNAINLKQSNEIIIKELESLKSTLVEIAIKHKHTYQIGRTHGMHAEIISFGLKIIGWIDELNRHISRFKLAANDIEIGKISGAVGTFANTPPQVQEYICNKLNIKSALFSNQIISRDIHSFYFDVINNIGLSINKFSTELRNLHRTEIAEVSEYFDVGQKGSSAMPHKKNPITLENICGLTRLLSGYAIASNNNVNLWHERDISHSSVERVVFLDAITLITYILRKFNHVCSTMLINDQKMLENISISNSSIFSGIFLNYLIKNTNLPREDIYDEIQSILLNIKNQKSFNFVDEIKKSKFAKYINNIDEILSFEYQLRNIDYIYEKVLNDGK